MVARKFALKAFVARENAEHLALAEALWKAIGPPGVLTPQRVMWWSQEHRNAPKKFRLDKSGNKVWYSPEGNRRKKIGVVPGLPDVCVRWWHKTFHIELKRQQNGVPSAEQLNLLGNFRILGDETFIAPGWEAAFLWLQVRVPMRLKPVIGPTGKLNVQ